MSKRGILRASVIQMLFNAVAIGLAFFREMLIANYFGTSAAADAYLVAYAIPLVLYTVTTTVLPLVLVPALERSGPLGEEGKRTLAGTNAIILVSLGILSVVMWLGAPLIIRLQAPGLDAETSRLAIDLFNIMVPIVLLLSLAWVAVSWMFSLKRFVLPALAKVLFNFTGVLILLALATRYGVKMAAFGVLIGAGLQLAMLVPGWLRSRMPIFSWKAAFTPQVRSVMGAGLIMIPVQANLYLYLVVDRFLASMLPQGTIAVLGYADKVTKAFLGITIAALGVVIFPYFAEMAAGNHREKLDNLVKFAIRLSALMMLPVQFGLLAAGKPLVRLLFERGAFLPQDTILTTVALNYQLIGLFTAGLSLVLYRVLFASRRYKTALVVSMLAVALNIALKVGLTPLMGYTAIPLSTSIASVVEAGMIAYALRRDVACFATWPVYRDVGKILAASLAAGASVYLLRNALDATVGLWQTAWAQVLVLAALGCAVYVAALALLRVEDMPMLAAAARRVLRRKALPLGKDGRP